MLHVYFGDMPNAIYNTAVYFKNVYYDDWIVDEFNKKMNRIMLIIEVFILIITLFLCGNTSNLNIWQIFNISLLACVFYNSLSDIVTEKSDYKAKLNKLELKRMYHTSLLDKNE